MKRIAIVTTQFPILTNAGGIAYVTDRLAKSLVKLGYSVDVLVLRTEHQITTPITEFYKQQSIKIIPIASNPQEVSPWWLSAQLGVERAICDGQYDVVIAQEWQGLLSLAAGLTIKHPPVITWLHGGVLYDRYGSERDFGHKFEFIDAVLEEIQIAKSTVVISPSNFLVNFYRDFGWRVENPQIIPYLIPEELIIESKGGSEIVLAFVGALSIRKGFDQFLKYAEELSEAGVNFSIRIYGRFFDIEEELIIEKLKKMGRNFSHENSLSPTEIWAELAKYNSTLLVPSRMDNSPGVIYEAMASGVKVLVSRSNGGAELVAEFPTEIEIITEPFVASHLEFINSKFKSFSRRLDFNSKVEDRWRDILESVFKNNKDSLEKAFSSANEYLDDQVSVVITTKNRPDFLKAALSSAINQTTPPLEVIVVEDTSEKATDVKQFCETYETQIPIRYFDVELELGKDRVATSSKLRINKLAASARNLGASKSHGSILAFLDDDNIFYPSHLEKCLARLRQENADAVTAFLGQVPSSKPLSIRNPAKQIAIMAGSHFGTLNALTNVSMDSEIVLPKSVFQAVGGFPLDAAPEDWGLALALMGKNFKIATTGEISILYRLNQSGIMASMAAMNSRWWELDRASAALLPKKEDMWWLTYLARNHFMLGVDFGTKAPRNSYFRYGVDLLKRGDFKLLLHGFKKYLIRRKFL